LNLNHLVVKVVKCGGFVKLFDNLLANLAYAKPVEDLTLIVCWSDQVLLVLKVHLIYIKLVLGLARDRFNLDAAVPIKLGLAFFVCY
jgi:hypothetical protein